MGGALGGTSAAVTNADPARASGPVRASISRTKLCAEAFTARSSRIAAHLCARACVRARVCVRVCACLRV